MRRTFQWVMAVLLLGLVGLAIVGLWLTGASATTSRAGANGAAGNSAASAGKVDEKPLATARALASLAVTPQEQSLSAEAMQLADHEIDLEFAQALRDAARQHTAATAATIRLEHRLKAAQTRVDADQATIRRLTRLAKHSRGAAQASDQAQLQLAQAELSLDQDELADARRDLLLAGGNEEAQLQQLLNEHEKAQPEESGEASESNGGAKPGAMATPSGTAGTSGASRRNAGRSLLAHLSAWEGVHHEVGMLARARAAALAMAARLEHEHDAIEHKVQAERAGTPAPGAGKGATAATASALSSMRQLKRDQQDLDSFDKRIETSRELADVYGRWQRAAQADAQGALHRLIRSVLWVLVILFLAVVADLLISHLFSGFSYDRKRLHTVRSVLHFTTRALTVVLILIVIFGPPRQLGTILGLAGAGLAVALKDFIVAFLGWFRLIGPSGMRPGDWVEINAAQQMNGVQGKVLEVGLLFTVILEAGNWTDAGQPTGRRVAFINSFAIEGYYFNFTSAGQWLWDEIQFGLPAGVNPYPLLKSLQRAAEQETERNAQMAERDWKRAMAGSGLAPFSAKSAITVRPTEAGLNVVIRYIAHADEREELRQKLYHTAFEILHGAGTFAGRAEGASPQAETA
jgi:small-conductance mechanosensitive channel